MAVYRQIYTTFWSDPKVDDEFTPEDKYFYLYLLTNPHTNICGCYEISTKQMERETGYNIDTVMRLIHRMERDHNVIRYDPATKEILLLNWHKYNWTSSPKVVSNIENVAEYIKTDAFKQYINSVLHNNTVSIPYPYPIDTVSIPYPYPMDTSVTVSVPVSDTDTVNKKNSKKLNEEFESWWTHYPKKVSKQDARRAWEKMRKANPDITTDSLIEAVEKQKQSKQWTKDGGQFIPNPATWLNGGRWSDELETEEKKYYEHNDKATQEDIDHLRKVFGLVQK